MKFLVLLTCRAMLTDRHVTQDRNRYLHFPRCAWYNSPFSFQKWFSQNWLLFLNWQRQLNPTPIIFNNQFKKLLFHCSPRKMHLLLFAHSKKFKFLIKEGVSITLHRTAKCHQFFSIYCNYFITKNLIPIRTVFEI